MVGAYTERASIKRRKSSRSAWQAARGLGLRPARKMSRRRVRSEIADSTAPGPGGVLTGRLGGGLYVYETSFFCRHNSRAHDRAQAARACRSTALPTGLPERARPWLAARPISQAGSAHAPPEIFHPS